MNNNNISKNTSKITTKHRSKSEGEKRSSEKRLDEKLHEKLRETKENGNKDKNKNKDKNDKDKNEDKKQIKLDYYAILGISNGANTSQKEIKIAYQKKLREYHPDRVSPTKENKIKFKLIREAGDVLNNELRRKAYDVQNKMDTDHSTNYNSQKQAFDDFIKLQQNNISEESKHIAKLNFEKSKKELDIKHGFNIDEQKAMDVDEFQRRIEDSQYQREQEDLNINHYNPFEGRDFDPATFNKLFERQQRKQKHKKKSNKSSELANVNDNDISPFTDQLDADFGSAALADNYQNLYDDTQYKGESSRFGGYDDDYSIDDSDISIDSIDSNDDTYYDKHREGATEQDLNSALERMKLERDNQDSFFQNMTDGNYKSVIDDKYGISKDFGFIIGTDKFGHQKFGASKNKSDIKKKTLEIYKELTEK